MGVKALRAASALFEVPTGCSTAFDAAPLVIVAHSLWVPDFLHVVDGYVELGPEPPGTRFAARATPGPLPVTGHQHHGEFGDAGLGLDEGLHTGTLRRPVTQVFQISSRVLIASTAGTPGASQPVEQSQLRRTPFTTVRRFSPSIVPERRCPVINP